VKCFQRDRHEPVGLPASAALGAHQADTVVYVGSVGTGFPDREASVFRKLMDLIKLPKSKLNKTARASRGSNRL